MEAWLAAQKAEYVETLQLVNALIAAGFVPVPTTPTSHDKARGDHTLAIIEVLSAWSESAVSLPLHLFSSGPVYEHGRWAESLDVEILEDGNGPCEPEMFATIDRLLATRSGGAVGPLTLVLGATRLLERVLTGAGCSDEEIGQIRRSFQTGHILNAERLIAARDPEVIPLLRPLPPQRLLELLDAHRARWNLQDPREHTALLPDADSTGYRVRWDLSLTGSWPYYSGMVCTLFAPDQGRALLKGGRFVVDDGLRRWHGVGFTIALDPWYASLPHAD